MNRYHQKTLDAIESATSGMTEEQLLARVEGKWSAAQIIEHLAIAFGQTAKVFQRCVAAGKPLGNSPTLKQRMMSAMVVDAGFFPKGREAPKQVIPTGKLGGHEALQIVRANLLQMDRGLEECERKLGNKGWLANHPVLGPLKVGQWPRFHWVHTKHHMKQIERMRRG
jgi:hypothetical protein